MKRLIAFCLTAALLVSVMPGALASTQPDLSSHLNVQAAVVTTLKNEPSASGKHITYIGYTSTQAPVLFGTGSNIYSNQLAAGTTV